MTSLFILMEIREVVRLIFLSTTEKNKVDMVFMQIGL